jgi:hypothetical protein
MPQLAIAAASALTVTAAGAITFSVSTFAINAVLGFALMALTPKQNKTVTEPSASGESVDSAAPHRLIYGRTKVGGVRVYSEETQSNRYLHKIIAFAGHEIESYDEIYLNDELVTINVTTGFVTAPAHYAGLVRLKRYYGTAGQMADADLVAESNALWSTSHRLRGIAYIYARFEFDADAYPNGEPIISVVVKGKKVYDPRSGLTAWSRNSALCLRDYLTSKYALQEVSANIDDALISSAADVCDDPVTTGSGTEARYACDGAIVTSAKPVDGVNAILVTMGGTLWFSQGKWRLKAGAWVTPVATFDESDLRSGLSISTRNSRRDNFNIVGGKFRGEASLWVESEYPEYRSDEFISVDGGLESRAEIDLLLNSSSSRAQRIAKLALYRSREQITVSATFSLRAMQLQVGDVIYLNNARAAWVSKAFEVQTWTFVLDDSMNLLVNMVLRETSESTYDWSLADESVFESNNSNLASPFYVEPVNLTVTTDVSVVYEKLTNILYANVTCTEQTKIRLVEVQFKKVSETEWTAMGSGPVGLYSYVDVEDDFYDVRARGSNYLDIKSDWVYVLNTQINALAFPPTDVTGFSVNLSGGGVSLTWIPTPDLDLSHYVVRHSVAESGATFGNATNAARKVSRPGASLVVPARPGTFHIKSYDKSGNASVSYASAVIPSAVMPVFATNPTVTKSSGTNFLGTKSNVVVTSTELRLSSYATAPASGTYDISNTIDTLTVRKVTSRVDVTVTRFANASGLWDDISGLWNDWPGLWDDWTGDAQLPDTDVVCYISTTNDDPTGGSPVWSAYVPFTAGEFYARAFRFRVELKTETANVTPSISSIVARVSY